MGHAGAIGGLLCALWEGGTLAQLSDSDLMKRFMQDRDQAGDAAFEVLIRRHGPMVFATCRRILHDQVEMEDAFQATFLVLVSKMHSIRGENLEPWLRRVARRVALRARATIDRRKARERAIDDPSVLAATPSSNEDLVALALDELNALPEHLRRALTLCDVEGMTIKQAAAELKCPTGTIESRLTRGRARLRKRLSGQGFDLSVPAGCHPILPAIAPDKVQIPTSLVARTTHLASMESAGLAGQAAKSAALEPLIRGTLRVMALRKIVGSVSLLLAVSIISGIGLRALATQVNAPPQRPAAAASEAATTEKSQLVRSLSFQPDPAAARDLLQSASPDSIRFVPSPERPQGIVTEPVYRSKPRYAVFRLGTGPRSTYAMAVDEPADGDWRIYVDANRNGDLSDDGDGRYDTVTKDQYDPYRMADFNDMLLNNEEMTAPIRSTLRERFLMLRNSLGTADKESSGGPHGVSFRRVVYHRQPLWNHEGTDYLRITGTAGGVGKYPDPRTNTMRDGCVVIESIGLVYPEKRRPGMDFGSFDTERLMQTAQQAWLLEVMKDGENMGRPGALFKLNCSTGVMTYFGRRVEWNWRPDGSRLEIAETESDPNAYAFGKGCVAPPFDLELPDSNRLKLSDLRGKVVVLALCRRLNESQSNLALLAHLNSIARATRENDVAVIAVAGLETRKTYQSFVARRRFDWAFPIAFDAAATTYRVYPDGYHFGLPAETHIYIIGRDGRLAVRFYIDGSRDDSVEESWLEAFTPRRTWVRFQPGDDTLEASLKSQGVQLRKPSDWGELPNSVWAEAREERRRTSTFR